MRLTLENIQQFFTNTDYENGMKYYRRGAVVSQTERMEKGLIRVDSKVRGSSLYSVSFWEEEPHVIDFECTCPRFDMMGKCKHIAAAMIYFSKQEEKQTDPDTRSLLQTYLDMAQDMADTEETPARLIPVLNADQYTISHYGYPYFQFRVGRERPYAVKHIKNFCQSVQRGETVTYGKSLTLNHDIGNFDEQSQKLIGILMDQFGDFRSIKRSYWISSPDYGYSSNKNEIVLTGNAFDRLFDLMVGQTIETNGMSPVLFAEEDPVAELTVKKTAKGFGITVDADQYFFFGSTRYLYAISNEKLLRCSPAFRRNSYPLFEAGNKRMNLSAEDMPTFCTSVLPRIKDSVTIEDPKGILQIYLPQECTPCFYFDMEEDLTLKLGFRYGDTELDENVPTKSTPHIKRNLMTEHTASAMADRYFSDYRLGRVLRSDLDPIDFLMECLDTFRSIGEVFVSERLKRKQLPPAKVNVGLSVSDGMLTLDMDTGEFPAEELEALYQSLLKKKKYHRLADGRYLTLDGSGYEKMSEMAHMLQLSAKDLAKGQVQVPAFRALYLDNLLSDSDGIWVQRDRQFRQMIRDFKSVGDSDFAVPENLEKTMRSYQRLGYQWLKTLESVHFGGILADEMGLGKTLQMIAYLSSLNREEIGLPSLVVCPASLILNWGDEFAKFAPQVKVLLVYGNAAQRKKLLEGAGETDVIVTSYELLRQDLKQYQQMEFYCCVLDEAQHVKNQTTQISKAVKQVNCRQRFILTGTPIENRLSELWNLFDFLMPGYLFSHTAFVQKLEKPIIKSGNQDAGAQLQKLVQPFLLRRLKKDVLKELPPKLEYVRSVPLSEEERKVYMASVNAAKGSLSGEDSKLKILAALTQLRQICCDPALCFENYHGETSKLEACLELCSGMVENGHQILLFSQFTSMLDILRSRLDELGISSFTLQGSTPKEKRAQLVKDFNAGKASVFLISLKAGGTGLNLTAADVVIHYDPWWNIAAQNQATDRAHRIGQQANVQVYKLITKGTIEEKILQLQEKKAALMEMISENTEGGIMNMSSEELLELLQYQGE